jgi:hypothetical protein
VLGGGASALFKADDDGRELVAGQPGGDGDPSWLLVVCIHRLMDTGTVLLNGLPFNELRYVALLI